MTTLLNGTMEVLMKNCPKCKMKMKSMASKCPKCGTKMPTSLSDMMKEEKSEGE